MFDDMTWGRLAVVLLFAISFMVMGTVAPILYATYVPQSEIITVHDFAAQNTTTAEDTHYVCFDRTVRVETTATLLTELYLVNGDTDQRIQISSEVMERYMDNGRAQVITPLDLPQDIAPGDYRYLLVVKMDMARDQVTRTFTFESNAFTVTESNVSGSGGPSDLC